jgi:hypothetical protein|tara:strand:+ start:3862 stop:4170 length:309 start_codon:yes stop_codon:yes gene_type:complete
MYYDKGTIKLVWIPKVNYKEMKSIMFASIPEAINHVKESGRSDYMLMRLLDSNDKSYRWEVLPYGSWNGYNYGMKIFKNKILMFSILGLTIYGGYKLIKDGI